MGEELEMDDRKERIPGAPKLQMHLKNAAQTRDRNEGEEYPRPGNTTYTVSVHGLHKQPLH